ncbi:putative polyketide synthase [Xylariaceae sp. AK1471]|nr:putative polyketide synthase [Xylariaceae sp. AK1471]
MDSPCVGAKANTQSSGTINSTDVAEAIHGTMGDSNANKVTDKALATSGTLPIAICGMACRLPGGLMTPQQLWDFVIAKGDGRSRVPNSRYNVDAFYSPAAKPNTVGTEYGYFLDENVDLGALDTSFFSMPRTDVESTDPQERLMLEIARECIEDAGVTGWSGKSIGCYIGNFGEDWLEISNRDTQRWGTYKSADFLISNRISYEMNLKGPSMTIRTGCSAALVGLNEACMAISSGQCEAALVGGTNLIMSPSLTTSLSSQGVLSKDGSCKTFSAEADGYARGEALAAVYIKPLHSALRDGNPIRAVIRATAINHDGKTNGIYQPSADAQEALIRKAYHLAGLSDFGETAMVECHGTGTPTGDLIETKAIARVFGEAGVYVGSVKPNIGHSEGASGLTSLIKMVLALENRTIPPNIKFITPNPNIPFKEGKLIVPIEPILWPQSRLERVSINSFGIGGANAHVILESATRSINQLTLPPVTSPQLLLYSATLPKPLTKLRNQYKEWVELNYSEVGDLAYTLAHRREHLPWRTFAVAHDGVIDNAPQSSKASEKHQVVMVFTGQGAQWPRMGYELFQSEEVFRSTIRSLDQQLRDVTGTSPPYSIEDELLKPIGESRLGSAAISQPLCTAIQLALVNTFKAIGVTPSIVVGHSSGEIAAAYASGALDASEAIMIAHYRGIIANAQKKHGSMAAISIGYDKIEQYLVPGACIACHNSPNSATISGDAAAVQSVIDRIRNVYAGVLVKVLPVDKAYHSSHMAEIGEGYRSLINQKFHERRPKVPFYSSVTGNFMKRGETLGSRYWQANLESPVLFHEAINAILKDTVGQNVLFLEVGPHSTLAAPLRQICQIASISHPYIPAMIRNRHCVTSFLAAVGNLFSLGIQIDMKSLIPSRRCLPDLPRYPWNHEESYWYEPRVSKDWRLRKHRHHNLLGVRIPENTDIEPSWRNLLHIQNVPWMRDHKLGDNLVFPLTGYLSIAGEAIRQVDGATQGYRVRSVNVDVALVLSDGTPTEIITTLREHRLTSSLDSKWWDFTITSFNGHVWTKHCKGQVTSLSPGFEKTQKPTGQLPKQVDARSWYRSMQSVGVNLGACFQTMSAMETSTTMGHSAKADVANGRHGDEGDYHIHPTALDVIFQLQSVSAVNGRARLLKNWIPVSIDELRVIRCESDMVAFTSSEVTSNGSIFGNGHFICDGVPVAELVGVRLSLADGATSSEVLDTHSAARLEWGPSLDFLSAQELINPSGSQKKHRLLLDELCLLYILSSRSSLSGKTALCAQGQQYLDWIVAQSHINTGCSLDEGNDELLEARISQLQNELRVTPAEPAAKALQIVRTRIDDLIAGYPIEDILSRTLIQDIHQLIFDADIAQLLRHMSHHKPDLRILELGMGERSLLSDAIRYLTRSDGQVSIFSYTSTSPCFMVNDRRHSQPFEVEYIDLDITKSLDSQSFETREFDLIVTRNVLTSSANTQATLQNLKALLSLDGRLLIQEIPRSWRWTNYIFGAPPNWSLGEPEATSLTSKFTISGLGTGLELTTDLESIHNMTTLIATVLMNHTLPSPRKRVTFLRVHYEATPCVFMDHFQQEGYDITVCTLNDTPPPGQDIIALLDEDEPFFKSLDEEQYNLLNSFLHSLDDCGIIWITPHSQMSCSDPSYSQVIGLARTLRSEMLLDFATCEVDNFHSRPDLIVNIFERFQTRKHNGSVKPDFEYAIKAGTVQVGRYYPFSLRDQLILLEPNDRVVLDVSVPGRLNTLQWIKSPRNELQANEVEIKVHSAGLNFKDVVVAMGIIELPSRQFGLEAAGVVTRVGQDVKEFEVGDRVGCMATQAFSSVMVSPDISCVRIPEGISFEEAATMIIPFGTVIHSLITVGQLEPGQSVLIHSACGGVGLAALQVARMIGADIYATVSTEEKASFLTDNFQIPRNRIFNSRGVSFLSDIMRETDGRGVDLVLNSLSGELLHASWECVAEFGTMIELGKRDLLDGAKLDMRPFLANRSYRCVAFDHILKRPILARRLIRSIFEFYEKGQIQPIHPIKMFEASHAQEAFQYMQKGVHIGRIGISMLPASDLTAKPRVKAPIFVDDASYLLIGGLGGIGRALSTYMAEHGARELIFLSRNAGSTPSEAAFEAELRSMGCAPVFVKGDVCEMDAVTAALARATRPLRGVVQLSMVLRDQNFSDMTFEQWKQACDPKIQGTWNLHHATLSASIELDFFVLCSSIAGQIGQPGQANYASANTFLDAFAQYRTGLGLVASVVDIGAVEDVGMLTHNQRLLSNMKATGFHMVKEQDLLDAMILAMAQGIPSQTTATTNPYYSYPNGFVLGIGPVMPLATWKNDRRMAVYNINASEEKPDLDSNQGLKKLLVRASEEPSMLKTTETAHLLSVEIGRKLADMLLQPLDDNLDTSVSLTDLGMDSLVAAELRAWWRLVFGFDVSVREIMGMGTLAALGKYAADGLLKVSDM